MVVVSSSDHNRMLLVRMLGQDAHDSLTSVRQLGDGGWYPLHVRCEVGGIPTQTVKINLNKGLLTLTKCHHYKENNVFCKSTEGFLKKDGPIDMQI
eukprot:1742551-Ditylum_brightwellii.AAC.1